MLQKVKSLILSAGLLGLIALPVALPSTAFADNLISGSVCEGTKVATDTTTNFSGNTVQTDNGCATDQAGVTGVSSLLKLVINIFSIIVGFVAVVMIIWGGVKYITSGGDSGNISGAKNTILYAIIGLIIVAIAQIIVHFVLAKAGSISG